MKIFVPLDAAARSMGADETARAIAAEAQRRQDRRSRSFATARGASCGSSRWSRWKWPGERYAYGPVSPGDVAGLFEAGFALPTRQRRERMRLAHGLTDEIPYFKRQQRLTFARVGITDPLSLSDYLAHGGYRGLAAALGMQPAEIVESVTASGLRGRGGAAFPAGIKWKTVLGAPRRAEVRRVQCG